jgi:hypothetical protein
MTYRIRILAALCLCGVALASAPPVNATAPTYTVTVIGPFSRQGVEAVTMNSHGAGVGYTRPNGDGARFYAAGDIVGWRANPSTYHPEVVLLQPST